MFNHSEMAYSGYWISLNSEDGYRDVVVTRITCLSEILRNIRRVELPHKELPWDNDADPDEHAWLLECVREVRAAFRGAEVVLVD